MATTPPTIHRLELLSADPFDGEYLRRLRGDLDEALLARFVMGYVSGSGLSRLGDSLVDALRKPGSYGLSTLSCSCDIAGMFGLWQKIGRGPDKLKYFLTHDDNKKPSPDSKFVHSKAVVIVRQNLDGAPPSEFRAVIYIGSHNWSAGALVQPSGLPEKHNVEATVRIETSWNHDWLEDASTGAGAGNVVVDVLRHIHRCWSFSSSTDLAGPKAKEEFEGWLRANCFDPDAPDMQKILLASGVLGPTALPAWGAPGPRGPAPFRFLRPGAGIYVQVHQNSEATTVFDSGAAWLLLLWPDKVEFSKSTTPWVVLCRPSELKRGGSSDVELERFYWVLWDQRQDAALATSPRKLPKPQELTLSPAGRGRAQYWDFTPAKPKAQNTLVDTAEPRAHVFLEIVAVVAPAAAAGSLPGGDSQETAGDRTDEGGSVDRQDERRRLHYEAPFDRGPEEHPTWDGKGLVFHSSSASRRRLSQERYNVYDRNGQLDGERAAAIEEEQRTLFGVDFTRSRARPTASEVQRTDKLGVCVAPVNALVNSGELQVVELLGEQDRAILEVVAPERESDKPIPRLSTPKAPAFSHLRHLFSLDDKQLERLGIRIRKKKRAKGGSRG